jgi:RNA polymerase sigma factor (TIGR02999 family)
MISNLQAKELEDDAGVAAAGDRSNNHSSTFAAEQVFEEMPAELYNELRRLAATYLRGERQDHTLQATALVHEAYLRIVGENYSGWHDRTHFFRFFARTMRQTLINHAVARTRKKRGGEHSIEMTLEFYQRQKVDVTAVDAALQDLEKFDPRQAQVVELRFFGGLTIPEIASALGISPTTVKREWVIAKLWLRTRLSKR